jgi:alpha-tubulin suppressor-like RCC1 family protein
MAGVVGGGTHTLVAGSDGQLYGFGSVRALGMTICDSDSDYDMEAGDGKLCLSSAVETCSMIVQLR